MGTLYFLLGCICLVGIAAQYKHGVFLEQLDGVTCLPGDRDQPDQILWYEVETSEGCVPDNMIGITLSSGEFARRWKGIYLHRRSDLDDYKAMIEMKGSESPLTMLIQKDYIERLYAICLWKDVDEVIGWGHRNIYYIRNTHDLLPGKLYGFHWIRDETPCM